MEPNEWIQYINQIIGNLGRIADTKTELMSIRNNISTLNNTLAVTNILFLALIVVSIVNLLLNMIKKK